MYISLKDYSRHIWKDNDFKQIYNFKVKVPIYIGDDLYCKFSCDNLKEVIEYFKDNNIEVKE